MARGFEFYCLQPKIPVGFSIQPNNFSSRDKSSVLSNRDGDDFLADFPVGRGSNRVSDTGVFYFVTVFLSLPTLHFGQTNLCGVSILTDIIFNFSRNILQ